MKETCTNEIDRLQTLVNRYQEVCVFYENDREEFKNKAASLQASTSKCSNCKEEGNKLENFITNLTVVNSISPTVEQGLGNGKPNKEVSKVMGENVSVAV